jgi:hypothetical protein
MGKRRHWLAIGYVWIDAGGAWRERVIEGGCKGGDGAVGTPWEGLLVGIEDIDEKECEGNGED